MNQSTIRVRLTAITGILSAFVFGLPLAFAQSVPTMSPGDSGSNVSALQTFLAADSSVYPEGLITGYYGSLTVEAVKRYQCKYGIVCQGTPSSTGYGRVGPATAAKIASQGGFMGGASSSGGVGGGDVSAPILSAPTVSVTASTASVHWGISESATSRVLYSTVMPSLNAASFASMQVATDPTFDTSGDVVLSGLAANTRYYYVLESADASGNMQYSLFGLANPFVTTL